MAHHSDWQYTPTSNYQHEGDPPLTAQGQQPRGEHSAWHDIPTHESIAYTGAPNINDGASTAVYPPAQQMYHYPYPYPRPLALDFDDPSLFISGSTAMSSYEAAYSQQQTHPLPPLPETQSYNATSINTGYSTALSPTPYFQSQPQHPVSLHQLDFDYHTSLSNGHSTAPSPTVYFQPQAQQPPSVPALGYSNPMSLNNKRPITSSHSHVAPYSQEQTYPSLSLPDMEFDNRMSLNSGEPSTSSHSALSTQVQAPQWSLPTLPGSEFVDSMLEGPIHIEGSTTVMYASTLQYPTELATPHWSGFASISDGSDEQATGLGVPAQIFIQDTPSDDAPALDNSVDTDDNDLVAAPLLAREGSERYDRVEKIKLYEGGTWVLLSVVHYKVDDKTNLLVPSDYDVFEAAFLLTLTAQDAIGYLKKHAKQVFELLEKQRLQLLVARDIGPLSSINVTMVLNFTRILPTISAYSSTVGYDTAWDRASKIPQCNLHLTRNVHHIISLHMVPSHLFTTEAIAQQLQSDIDEDTRVAPGPHPPAVSALLNYFQLAACEQDSRIPIIAEHMDHLACRLNQFGVGAIIFALVHLLEAYFLAYWGVQPRADVAMVVGPPRCRTSIPRKGMLLFLYHKMKQRVLKDMPDTNWAMAFEMASSGLLCMREAVAIINNAHLQDHPVGRKWIPTLGLLLQPKLMASTHPDGMEASQKALLQGASFHDLIREVLRLRLPAKDYSADDPLAALALIDTGRPRKTRKLPKSSSSTGHH